MGISGEQITFPQTLGPLRANQGQISCDLGLNLMKSPQILQPVSEIQGPISPCLIPNINIERTDSNLKRSLRLSVNSRVKGLRIFVQISVEISKSPDISWVARQIQGDVSQDLILYITRTLQILWVHWPTQQDPKVNLVESDPSLARRRKSLLRSLVQ